MLDPSDQTAVHDTLRMTPAMAIGAADHIWTVGELVEVALAYQSDMPTDPTPPILQGKVVGRFRVIGGGRA